MTCAWLALTAPGVVQKRMLEKLLGFLEPSRRTAKPMKVQILQSLSIFFQVGDVARRWRCWLMGVLDRT